MDLQRDPCQRANTALVRDLPQWGHEVLDIFIPFVGAPLPVDFHAKLPR